MKIIIDVEKEISIQNKTKTLIAALFIPPTK